MADLRIGYACQNPGDLYVYARVLDGSPGAIAYNLFAGSFTGTADAGEEVEICMAERRDPSGRTLSVFDPTDHVITIDWTIKQTANCLFAVTAVGG